MDEQEPIDDSPNPNQPRLASPAIAPKHEDRTAIVITAGLMAGLGLSLAFVFLMHIVQEASPYGPAMNINGSVFLELLVAGPVFGLGLALAMLGLFPPTSDGASPASAGPAKPTDTQADV